MGIQIQIVAGKDKSSSSVQATGNMQHVITDEERTTFGIGDHALKQAVAKYFGKKPNDAFLHSPTPWNDLYKTYNWSQVKTIIVVESAEILEITSQPTIIASRTFSNKSNVEGTFNAGISEQVTNSVTSNWSVGGTLTISEQIECGVQFEGIGVKSTTSMSYSQSWGVGGAKTQQIAVGSESGVSVKLKPGESVESVLTASRGVMKVRVRYRAYLTGNVAVNYNPTFKGHHFWCLPVTSVMSAAGISNNKSYTEDMEIGYYSDSSVELKSPEGAIKAQFKMADVPATMEV